MAPPNLQAPIPLRPAKPALKLRAPTLPPLALPPQDLTALVTASIRACASPRRNQPDFYFCNTQSNPVAPPPTPVEDSFLHTPTSATSTPRSEKRVHFEDWSQERSPRSSEESVRSTDSVKEQE